MLLAEKLLRPTLARAEGDLGRRSPFTCMLAAVLAAAIWERNRQRGRRAAREPARRPGTHGFPKPVLLGYRTMARIATAEGAEHRALELLGALDAVGLARGLPRLRIASLTEQVRLHARRFRAETCRDLCARIDAQLGRAGRPARAALAPQRRCCCAKWRTPTPPSPRRSGAVPPSRSRAPTRSPRALKLGRLHIELLGLRAFALDRCGEKSLPLLREAADLARRYGLQRVFDDAHPALGDWVRQALATTARHRRRSARAAGRADRRAAAAAPRAPCARSMPSMALTPKEREVLELLARNLSNKEIGLAMQVGEETIKWHVKNLFAKLDAGTRKQVVQRARLLGLLDGER